MKTKKIIAFFIAVGIVFNSITVVNAASQRKVCQPHIFEEVEQPAGYTVDGGSHMYLYGIHSDGSSEYRECKLTDVYQYYREICKNCGIRSDRQDISKYVKTLHSAHHN